MCLTYFMFTHITCLMYKLHSLSWLLRSLNLKASKDRSASTIACHCSPSLKLQCGFAVTHHIYTQIFPADANSRQRCSIDVNPLVQAYVTLVFLFLVVNKLSAPVSKSKSITITYQTLIIGVLQLHFPKH